MESLQKTQLKITKNETNNVALTFSEENVSDLENSKLSKIDHLPKKLPTPIKSERLRVYLSGYNTILKNYLLSGFKFGFRLDNTKFTPSDNDKTLKSARILPDMISTKLEKEIRLGRIQGLF